MHLLDPNRPKAPNGMPQFADCSFTAVLPTFYIRPLGHGQFLLMASLGTGKNSFNLKTTEINLDQINLFFLNYEKDPESVIKEYFNWTPKSDQNTNFHNTQTETFTEKASNQKSKINFTNIIDE